MPGGCKGFTHSLILRNFAAMAAIEITELTDPRIAAYASLTEHQLRNRLDPTKGVMIVESPKVIEVALRAGYRPISLLCEKRHISGDAAPLLNLCPEDMPVYTGDRDTLAALTGYTLTRGVLCAMERPMLPDAARLTANAILVGVIDAVTDTTNIGAIFRSAAALGVDAVLLTRQSCDPLNRRSIRVSMGSVFLVPWAWIDHPVETPRSFGFTTAAMALTDDSVSIESPLLAEAPRVALIFGTEGEGLDPRVIAAADLTVKIPMSHSVDSLNVAAAAAVAFWQLRRKDTVKNK